MNERIISASEMINAAFRNIDKTEFEKNNRLYMVWEKTLLNLDERQKKFQDTSTKNSNGEENCYLVKQGQGQGIFSHSRILEIKNGILFVEVDHPGWGELLKLNQKFIVNGLNFDKEIKNFGIKSIAFKLAGSRANVSERELNDYKNHLQEKLLKQSEEQQKFYKENLPPTKPAAEKKELPPEMLEMFERMNKLVE